ncbi:MAG TPA: hypothetical protein PKE12_14030 [Kiritimatiellia bacterium]|nr:hypothetical protein [Kiritimatiellia bacterium]
MISIHPALAALQSDIEAARAEFPAFSMSVVAQGLQDPDGLAIHPASGELYVSEEGAGRISVIRGGRAVPVIGPEIRVAGAVPVWLLSETRPESYWRTPRLRSPEGICFSPEGALLVVEDTPGGRVLAFEPDADGRFGAATVVPIPNLGDAYAWESISADAQGRLYLAGSSHEGALGWGASCVMIRETDGAWWMADYSPLASFSAVAVSGGSDVLVVGDESVNGVTWWDVARQREIQTFTHDLKSIEGLTMLPDGSLAIAQESVAATGAGPAGGRLVRLDPASGRSVVIASGLGTIESVVFDERTGRLYVTEDSTGRILAFTPDAPWGPARFALLETARRGGEARRGLPPRATPDFLKQFMKEVGVDLTDSGVPSSAVPGGEVAEKSGIPPLTLEELGRRIPLVAGRLKVEELEGVDDPVVEISFINLFPGQMVKTDGRELPGLCLYTARHRSGRVVRSELVEGLQSRKLSMHSARPVIRPHAMMVLPLATCTAVESENGVTVSMTFLGLERFPDSFLTLNYGRQNDAYFSVAGEQLRVAKATFSEKQLDGREIVNFAMTGVRPRRAEDAVWLKLHVEPRWSLLSPAVEPWVPRWSLANMPELVARMRKFNQDVIDGLLAAEDEAGPDSVVERKTDAPDAEPAQPNVTGGPASYEPGRALLRPGFVEPPLARIQFAPPSLSEEEQLLTNLILSRIVQAWKDGYTP